MTIKKSLHHYIINLRMGLYRQCLAHCQELMKEELKRWQKDWVEGHAEFEDEETEYGYYEFVNSQLEDRLEFQSILISSLFTASFAVFEYELITICELAKLASKSPFSEDDLSSSSPTRRAQKYLTTLGIEFPSDSPLWEQITKYRDIRNKIMHTGGKLKASSSLAEYATKKEIIGTGGESPQLALSRPFYEEAVTDMETFLCKVVDAYETWRRNKDEDPEPSW